MTMASDSSSSPESPSSHNSNVLPDPIPHFPVGTYEMIECNICLVSKWMHRRVCCSFPACSDCLTSYYAARIDLGQVSIECINTLCRCFVHRDEISLLLPASKKTVYNTLLANSNSDNLSKTCPRCNQVLKLESVNVLKSMERASKKNPAAVQVVCEQCSYCWCFPCASPWHEGISCRQYLKGDRLLQEWAKKVHQGQVNAQKCPKCKILIQKSSGCDHMHCPRCKTDFCYRCGDSLRRLKFFGDHYSKLSVFGCKYRYKAGQPVQRKLIRGAVFASKLMMAPVLGSLALVAGAVVVGVGVAALPLYGGMRLYRKYQHVALTRSPFQAGNLDAPTRDTVSTAAQTVRITFMADNYVDDFENASGM
jgi:E3 ubiquitin-protein ligase RNF217